MSISTTIEHGLYRVLNPVMKTVLRSPLHRVASRTIAVLHYRGRKSGREFVTPLSYVREDGTIWFLSGLSTNWWKNFRAGDLPVSIEIAKATVSGTARLWEDDTAELRDHVSRFLTALPRDARVYGIKLDENKVPIEESVTRATPGLVMVEVALSL